MESIVKVEEFTPRVLICTCFQSSENSTSKIMALLGITFSVSKIHVVTATVLVHR